MRALVAPSEAIFLDAKFEAELVELDDDDEAREMLEEMGITEPGPESQAPTSARVRRVLRGSGSGGCSLIRPG